MVDNLPLITETIVSTLLHVSGLVVEVSLSGEITGRWELDASDEKLRKIDVRSIIRHYETQISNALCSGKSETDIYSIQESDKITKYKVRILPIHPGKDLLFVCIEFISEKDASNISEEYLREALDAASDGMWDLDTVTNKISLSSKWFEIFGYNADKISTTEHWVSLIHPDDRSTVIRRKDEYFDGNSKYYQSEFRIRCEDGSYKWVMSRGVVMSRDNNGKIIRFIGTHTDISNRIKNEHEFASTANLLTKLIGSLNDGILVTNQDNKITYANKAFFAIHDFELQPEDIIGHDVLKGLKSNRKGYKKEDYIYDRTVELLKNKTTELNEEWELKSGKVLSRDFIPVTDSDKNIQAIWQFRDITEHKNIENRLSELRNFYEQILNNIATDIVVYDAQQRYIFINPTAIKNDELRAWMIGKTDEDYAKLRNKDEAFITRRKKVLEDAKNKRQIIEWEEMLVNRAGETEHHLRYMFPVFDSEGNQTMGIGYGMNITERVRVQQELKTSRDTFANAFNDSGIGMALISPDGSWIDANHMLCKMTGYPKQMLMEVPLSLLTHPEDENKDKHLIRQMLKNEISTYTVEKRYISRHYKIVQVQLTVSLVRDVAENPKFYIVQAIDVTAQKNMEQEIKKKNADLEVTTENLISKINQLEDLSHIIAHNLRGPAGNIKMLSDSLLSRYRKNGDDDNSISFDSTFTEEEAITLINEGSQTLMDSLATLMQVTEIKLDKNVTIDNCNIAGIVNDVRNQLQSVVFEKKAIFNLNLDVPEVKYHRLYLENILYNLMSNALKYSQKDKSPEIIISTAQIDDRVQLSVKDNGLGIDLEKYGNRVFRLNEIFHQGYDSKGVGLYITKTQIESFGGSITVKSKPNEGCEFIVTL